VLQAFPRKSKKEIRQEGAKEAVDAKIRVNTVRQPSLFEAI
jgi:hypothetical protein